jgi:hypothetical protein
MPKGPVTIFAVGGSPEPGIGREVSGTGSEGLGAVLQQSFLSSGT